MAPSFYRGLLIGIIFTMVIMSIFHQIGNLLHANQYDTESNSKQLPQRNQTLSTVNISTSSQSTSLNEVTTPTGIKNDISDKLKRIPIRSFSDVDKSASINFMNITIDRQPAPKHETPPIPIQNKIYNDNLKDPLTKQQCKEKFGNRRFYSLEEKRLPPMFYTFPGSGNTWGRLLIEYATSIYTGSVYNDKSLLEALPGEFTCDHRVSAVKVHPHTHAFIPLRDGTFHSDENKCKRGNVRQFRRAILLIRNPYDSIWSEYQRRVTQSHVEGILKSSFDWKRWQANAAQLSHEYHDMWSQHYATIDTSFQPNDVLYIRYEDLKNASARVATLKKAALFLGISSSDEKLACAFISAESSKAHRAIDTEIEMTKDVAYSKPLACRMWKLFGKYCMKHNYKSWGDYDCEKEDYPPMPRVNVGPRGEYDFKWVKPGQKLLDFGGYEKAMENGAGSSSSSSTAVQQQLRINKVQRLSPATVLSFHKKIQGMILNEAMEVNGVGKLGEDGPIWK